MNPYIAIPIYDHGETIGAVIDSISYLNLPCIIVDDGSGSATSLELDCLANKFPWVDVVRHPRNLGRGAALCTAYRESHRRGASHVVQLDADGQHDPADIPQFIDAARERSDALVLGSPIFDDSIPWHRLHGRRLSQWAVWLETRSMSVADPLCGFRCIPLASVIPLIDRCRMGNRMDFDPELIIRMVRNGVPIVNIPTSVRYPETGTSHFRMVEDNLLIAWAYLRLSVEPLLGVLGMQSGPERRS